MPLSVLSLHISKRAAQAAITFNQGVLKSHSSYITMQIAWPTNQDTLTTKRHTHHRKHNWGRAIIGQYVVDVWPITISAESC